MRYLGAYRPRQTAETFLIKTNKRRLPANAKQLHCSSSRPRKESKQSQASNFFMYTIKSNHTTFLVQFGIYLHSCVFQKAQILIVFEKHTRAIYKLVQINFKLNEKSRMVACANTREILQFCGPCRRAPCVQMKSNDMNETSEFKRSTIEIISFNVF